MIWLFRSVIVILAYLGINIYSGIRLFGFIRHFLPFSKIFVFWPIYILLCYSFILVMLLRLEKIIFIRQAGMYAFPFFIYLFMALILMDGLRFALLYFNRIPNSPALSAAGTGIALALALLAMVYGTIHARSIRTVHYNITINKSLSADLGEGLRIALVSDLHIGAVVGRNWVANIVDTVNKTEPDIILITGDIFDNSVSAIRDPEGIITELLRLKAPYGAFACGGNHDVDRLAWGEEASTEGIYEFLKRAGITLLQDEYELIANGFYLFGRRDVRPIGLSQTRKTAAELTSELDKSRLILFLDHQPVDFTAMEEAGADLILSGHTHRGQFFPGGLFTKQIFKRAGAVHYGLWQGRLAQGVVTSGAGVWGPPIRTASNSEVVVVNINSHGPGAGALP